jgi:hypothetical protein
MNRKRKMELLQFYTGNKCCCGNDKLEFRWLCLTCKEKMVELGEWALLSAACESHLSMAERILENCGWKSNG